MAAEHSTADELQSYMRGALPPGERLRLSDHLAICEECRERARADAPPPAFPPGDEEALRYETLADYLDNQLDPMRREEVRAQLRHSPRAAAELADLARFRDETNALPERGKVLAFPGRFAPWLLPLAALIFLSLGGIWWHARSLGGAPLVTEQELAGLPPGLQAAVATAAQTGRLEIPPSIKSLGGARERLAGAADEAAGFQLVRPKATAIRAIRPQFQWTARAGATGYRVLVAESESGDLVASGRSEGTSWQPATPLAPGGSYQWQVEALRGTEVIERVPRPPESEVRFVILSAAARNEFEKSVAQSGGSHLVKAVAAARAGLLEEAADELRGLAEENPASKIPGQLRAQLPAADANFSQ